MFNSIYLGWNLFSTAVSSTLEYFIKGPRSAQWPLRLQVSVDVARRQSKIWYKKTPITNDTDIKTIIKEYSKYTVHEASLPKSKGTCRSHAIPVSTIEVDRGPLEGLIGGPIGGPIGAKLSAQVGSAERDLPFEIIVSANAADKLAANAQAGILDPAPMAPGERILVYFHGGGYTCGSSGSHRGVIANISRTTRMRCFAVNYRLAPAHPFPAQLYDGLLALLHFSRVFGSANIVVAGDSAGGNLALSVVHLIRALGLPAVAGVVLLSPWSDLVDAGESVERNAEFDYMSYVPLSSPVSHARVFFAPGEKWSEDMARMMRHFLVSPLNGDFGGFPPVLVQYGERELLADGIERLVAEIRGQNAGCEERYLGECYLGMVHVFHFLDFTIQAEVAFENIGKFVSRLWD